MWVLTAGIITVLICISVQDFKSRSVYVLWFPVLILLFILWQLSVKEQLSGIIRSVSINLTFLIIQFLILKAVFSLKYGYRLKIIDSMLGWGDILFLISVAFCLPVFNFMLFYLLSLVVVLFFWFLWQLLNRNGNKQVPLAGLQAVQLAIILLVDQFNPVIDLANDTWFQQNVLLWN